MQDDPAVSADRNHLWNRKKNVTLFFRKIIILQRGITFKNGK